MTTETINDNAALMLTPPRGDMEKAQAMIRWIRTREQEILADIEGLEINAENYKSPEVSERVKMLADAIEDLRDGGKKLIATMCAETELQRVITQIDSRLWSYSTKADPGCTYAKLSAALKVLKAKIAAEKEAHTSPAPMHTYVIVTQCTDKQLAAILKKVESESKGAFRFCTPQTDKAVKAFQKLMEENQTSN